MSTLIVMAGSLSFLFGSIMLLGGGGRQQGWLQEHLSRWGVAVPVAAVVLVAVGVVLLGALFILEAKRLLEGDTKPDDTSRCREAPAARQP